MVLVAKGEANLGSTGGVTYQFRCEADDSTAVGGAAAGAGEAAQAEVGDGEGEEEDEE